MVIKKKIILISVVSGIVGLAFIFLLIYPLFKKIIKNSQEIVEVRKEIVLSQGKAGGISQIKKDFKKLKPDLEKIDSLFVNSEAPIGLIEFLEKTAANSGVSIEIKPVSLKESKEDPWDSIGFQITTISSSDNSLRFLEKLETAPYLIKIQSVVINKLGEQDLKSQRYEGYSLKDVILNLKIKVFTKYNEEKKKID